ncbi:MAG TPA: hypothetical protein VGQ69_07880 [Gemmatimonadales bacterium]|nr:hypothetical protein [Gemmatimonadales bacterium]
MRAFPILLILIAGCRDSTPDSRAAAGDSSVAAVVADSAGMYELDLPSRWKGHFRVDSLSTAERGRAQPGALVFQYLPSDSTLRPQALLVVAVYDSAIWQSVRAEAGPPPGDSVAARNGRVYVVALPQSNPFAPGSTDATVFSLLQLRPAELATLVRLR